jgi:hypothetical protein
MQATMTYHAQRRLQERAANYPLDANKVVKLVSSIVNKAPLEFACILHTGKTVTLLAIVRCGQIITVERQDTKRCNSTKLKMPVLMPVM